MSEDVEVSVSQDPPVKYGLTWIKEVAEILQKLGVLGGVIVVVAGVFWPKYGMYDRMNEHAKEQSQLFVESQKASDTRFITYTKETDERAIKVAQKLTEVTEKIEARQEKQNEKIANSLDKVAINLAESSKTQVELSRELSRIKAIGDSKSTAVAKPD